MTSGRGSSEQNELRYLCSNTLNDYYYYYYYYYGAKGDRDLGISDLVKNLDGTDI